MKEESPEIDQHLLLPMTSSSHQLEELASAQLQAPADLLGLGFIGLQGLAPHNSGLSMALAAPQAVAEQMSMLLWIPSQHQMQLLYINNLANCSSMTPSFVNQASEASTGLS